MSYYPYVDHILERASVKRAQEAMDRLNVTGRIHALSESARTAQEAADSLGVEVGQISPLGWISKPEIILIDEALNDYEVVWAAAGHPHAVYPTSYDELLNCTGATPMVVGD